MQSSRRNGNECFTSLVRRVPKGWPNSNGFVGRRREEMRFGQCETLIRLVHEYDSVLSPLEKAIVAYHEGKLAADRRQWSTAEELYNRVLSTPELSAQMRVKTLCRLGIVEDDQ